MSIIKHSSVCILITVAVFFPIASAALTITVDNDLTPLGRNATYTCTGGTNIDFIPDVPGLGPKDTATLDDRELLEARGIVYESTDSGAMLTVLATAENNGTVVSCRMTSFFNPEFSGDRTFMVIGPPLPPSVNSSLENVTVILLQWDEPFTWTGFDVLMYVVTEVIEGEISAMYNITETSHTYSSPTGEVAESCQVVTFKVAAVSDAGQGEPGVVMDTLPIAPGIFEEPQISEVQFQSNGDPEPVTVTVQPPAVCEFQNATVSIQVREANDSAEDTSPLTMEVYSGQPSEVSAVYGAASGLRMGVNYSVLATVDTVTGSVSAEAFFNTFSSSNCGLLPVMWSVLWSIILSATLVLL